MTTLKVFKTAPAPFLAQWLRSILDQVIEAGKLPEKETTRIKKLHNTTCNSIDGEGRPNRRDLYGKRYNKR